MNSKIIFAGLCYKLNGIFFKLHNELGRFCSERQYCDAFELFLQKEKIPYFREARLNKKFSIGETKRNRVDFIVYNKILIDFKAKPIITKDDYYQAQKYLTASNLKLLLIVNFRQKYVRPKRVLNSQAKINNVLDNRNFILNQKTLR